MLDPTGPVNDFGDDASEHLAMLLENSLDLQGRPAIIWDAVITENEYAHVYDDLYPETPDYLEPAERTNPEPSQRTCRVLLGQAMKGLPLSDFISLSDKVETEIPVTTDTKLEPESIIQVFYPGNHSMKLRITAPMGFHADTFLIFRYTGIVM